MEALNPLEPKTNQGKGAEVISGPANPTISKRMNTLMVIFATPTTMVRQICWVSGSSYANVFVSSGPSAVTHLFI